MFFVCVGLCAQAISAVNPPDSISAMEFLSGRSTDLLLAVGTKHGKVLAVPSDHGHSTLSVNQRYRKAVYFRCHYCNDSHYTLISRVSKQQEAYYGDLVCSSGHDCDSEVMSLEVNPALRSAVSTSLPVYHCIVLLFVVALLLQVSCFLTVPT